MKSKYSWFDESGRPIVKTPSQQQLAVSPEAADLYRQYAFFRGKGKDAEAEQIRQDAESAMQLAYERDTGGPAPAAIDTKGIGFTK